MQISHCTLSNTRGAMAIIAGFALLLVLGFAAFVVDIGYGLVVRNALQNVADATSLAAARELGKIYVNLPVEEQSTYQLSSAERQAILDKAIEQVGKRNSVAGKAVQINETDIAIGHWDWDANTKIGTFTVSNDRPDAVRVVTRRDALGNGALHTFFAGIIGRDTIAVNALATAALSGLGYVGPGTLEMPVGISEAKFTDGPDNFCGIDIQFYPTGTEIGCGGWTTYQEQPSNASTLEDILEGLIDDSYVPPAVQAGSTTLEFTGGNVAASLPTLKAIYDARKDANDNWETTVAVYAANDCANPSGEIGIVGFTKVIITNVLAPPDGQQIDATIICEKFEEGRGGGTNLGVYGSIPNLVQ